VQPLEASVAFCLSRHVRHGETVTVGLSGGVDSVVLLDALRRASASARIGLRAVHVNHGLSKNASAWQRFCREHCRRRGIAFSAVRVEVAGGGRNVEAEARAARYRALAQHGSEVIALAHNENDQAETVLLHLLRGSGVQGLAGMPPERPLDSLGHRDPAHRVQRLIRPLLEISRGEILAYAARRRLRWIDDESNRDERFARNFLRRRVLPLLEGRFGGCSANLARAAAHMQEAASLLGEFGAMDCAAVSRDGRLHALALMTLGPARAINALRVYLAGKGEPPPSSVRMKELLRQLGSERADAQPEVELALGVLRRYRGWIEWQPRMAAPIEERYLTWRGERRLALGQGGVLIAVRTRGGGVSAARLGAGEVTIRRRRGGERMRLEAARPTRTLKNLLQEAGIAPWQRARMPLVFCGEQLVWVPLVGEASEFRAGPRESAWRFEWIASEDVRAEP